MTLLRNRPAVAIASEAPAAHPSAESNIQPDSTAKDLLRHWLALSELERRAFIAMARELTTSSTVIEHSAIDLSLRFQTLADSAKAQMTRVETIIDVAQSIDIDGTKVALSEATRFIESILIRVIDTVLAISKNAMRIVYSLDDVETEVKGASESVKKLHAINQQTRFLALNAAIEAARDSSNGGAFTVIAREIRELSKETDQTTRDVSGRIVAVAESVHRSHDLLRELATIDMSEHIIAKERLDALLTGMIAQNEAFTVILNETAGASADLATAIAPLIVGLQFQDRTAQHLSHVISALDTLGHATESLQEKTHAAMPGVFKVGEINQEWLDQMLQKQTLGAVRERFLTHLVTDAAPDEVTPDEEACAPAGDIDLF